MSARRTAICIVALLACAVTPAAPAQEPDDPAARARRALADGRAAEAIAILEEALDVAPGRADLWYFLGRGREEGGALDGALTAYGRAVDLAPEVGASWCGMGSVLAAMERYAEAASALERCTERSPETSEAWLNLGLARLRAGDPAGAVAPLVEAGRRERTATAAVPGLRLVARQLLATGGDDATILACGALRTIVEVVPADARAWARLAHAYTDLGLQAEAARAAEEAAERAAGSADLLVMSANALIGAGRSGLAAELLRRAVGIAPDDAMARHHLGLALAEQQELEEALGEFEAALALDPGLRAARREGARVALALGRPARALELLDGLGSVDADDARALRLRGQALLEAGDHAAAVETLEEARSRGAADDRLLYLLARAYGAAGRNREATAVLEEFDARRQELQRSADRAEGANMWTSDRAEIRARVRLAERRFATALEILEELSERRPDDPRILELMATAHDGLGDAERARRLRARAERLR